MTVQRLEHGAAAKDHEGQRSGRGARSFKSCHPTSLPRRISRQGERYGERNPQARVRSILPAALPPPQIPNCGVRSGSRAEREPERLQDYGGCSVLAQQKSVPFTRERS
jgi:hypothetical protein